jgi:hypothetical protein
VAVERTTATYKWLYLLVLVAAVAVFGVGVWQAASGHGWAMLAAGSVCVVGVMIAWPLMLALGVLEKAALSQQSELTERLQQISILMNTMSEQQLLSDRAKSVAFREKDREALRRAIHEEIARRDYEAALVLVTDMESTFGYRQEADRFRREVESRRQDEVRRQITDAGAMIDRHCRGENWPEACREAERILHLYPDHELARNLLAEIENRKQALKRQLLDQVREAEQRNDVEGGLDLVRRLDLYLTPAEAEQIRDTARSIFRQKLLQLGQQFNTAVNEGRADEARRIGAEITRDYPNTRMAQEVKERLNGQSQAATA